MLLPLKMIGSCQNVGKFILLATFVAALLFCSSLERFWGSFVAK